MQNKWVMVQEIVMYATVDSGKNDENLQKISEFSQVELWKVPKK